MSFGKENGSVIKEIGVLRCEYRNHEHIDVIDISKLLRGLGISSIVHWWGVDYNYSSLIKYNIDGGYSVRYFVDIIKVRSNYVIKIPFEVDIRNYKNLSREVEVLNSLHDRMLRELDMDGLERYYRHYGNDYSKQLLGG